MPNSVSDPPIIDSCWQVIMGDYKLLPYIFIGFSFNGKCVIYAAISNL